jgi:hypothetical protein
MLADRNKTTYFLSDTLLFTLIHFNALTTSLSISFKACFDLHDPVDSSSPLPEHGVKRNVKYDFLKIDLRYTLVIT